MNTKTAVGALLVALILGTSSAVMAQEGDSPQDTCSVCGDAGTEPDAVVAEVVVIVPGETGTTFTIPTGSSYLAGCSFEFTPAGETPIGEHFSLGGLVDGAWPVDYWVIFCGGSAIPYTAYPDGDPPPADVVQDMLLDAYQRTPIVGFNSLTSPDGDEAISLITQLPTFLWVDEAAWATPVSAVASIPGFTVTSTATPSIAYWSGGDEPVDCTIDDMKPYVFGIGGDDAQPSNCTMTYKQSSALGDQFVNLDVEWTVVGTCSIPVCGGPLPPLTSSTTREVIVGEIQAIETN